MENLMTSKEKTDYTDLLLRALNIGSLPPMETELLWRGMEALYRKGGKLTIKDIEKLKVRFTEILVKRAEKAKQDGNRNKT